MERVGVRGREGARVESGFVLVEEAYGLWEAAVEGFWGGLTSGIGGDGRGGMEGLWGYSRSAYPALGWVPGNWSLGLCGWWRMRWQC